MNFSEIREFDSSWILKSLEQKLVCVDLCGRVIYASSAAICLSEHEYQQGVPLAEFLPFLVCDGESVLADLLRCSDGDLKDCRFVLPYTKDSQYKIFIKDIVDDVGGLVGRSLFISDEPVLTVHYGDGESHLDPLTELMGRQEFERRLANLVNDASTSSRTHALLYIDIDQFKLINDTSGHGAGDNLIKVIADALKLELFIGDMLCRLGGDEFGVLLSNVDAFEARSVANRLVKAIKRMPFVWSGISHKVSISIGVVLIDEYTTD